MKEKRSSVIKKKQLETKSLEDQTKKMEDKLAVLKAQIEQQKQIRAEKGLDNTLTRWQKTAKTTNGPLKSYAKQVLEEQKQAHRQFGINQKKVTGTKTFQNVLKQIKGEKEAEEDRNPTRVPSLLPVHQSPIATKPPLQDNFFKARMEPAKLVHQKSLLQFLEDNYLQQYMGVFEENGVNQVQDVARLTRQQLQEMGVMAGHQVKLLKRANQQLNGGSKVKEETLKETGGKVESGYGEGDVNEYAGQPELQKIEVPPPLLKQQTPYLTEGDNRPPVSASDEEEEEDGQFAEEEGDVVILSADMALQATQQQPSANCYECYRTILCPLPELTVDEKAFCSQPCLQKYLSTLRRRCPACGKGFLKTEGYCEEGMWFCSLGCCPNHEDIEEMFLAWHGQR